MTPQRASSLHGDTCIQRAVGGMVATEVLYSPSLTIPRHDHELASVSVVLAGGYDETFGGRRRRAVPGSVIVHPEGEHHSDQHGPGITRLLNIEIGSERLQELRGELRYLSDAWDRHDFRATVIAHRICLEVGATDGSGLILESLVLELFAILDRSHEADVSASAWVLKVRDALECPSTVPPSILQLSQLAGVHTVHLARTFKRHFGCTIGEYARRIRIGRALARLQDPAISLTDVALEAGFSDQSHMNRCLVAHTGLTPGAWRRRRL
jgi:AraC family transcriptional regulator